MPKPENLFYIREMAATCGVSINALRFYEAKGLLKPAYTDPESGYRYFSRSNLFQLREILNLKDVGLSLLEIKIYLDGNKQVDKKIEALEERHEQLCRAIDALKARKTKRGSLTVEELRLPERHCICKTIEAEDGEQALTAISDFYDELIRKGIPISHMWPEFCVYPDEGLLKGEFKVSDCVVIVCLPVDNKKAPSDAVLYPSGDAVAVSYRGSIYNIWEAYHALSQYIESHEYIPIGYPQEIYLESESDGSMRLDSEENLTRVIIPVNKVPEAKAPSVVF